MNSCQYLPTDHFCRRVRASRVLLGAISGQSAEHAVVLLPAELPHIPVPKHQTDAEWVYLRCGAFYPLVPPEEHYAAERRAHQLSGRSHSNQGKFEFFITAQIDIRSN